MAAPLWTPSEERIRSTRLHAFRLAVNEHYGLNLQSYEDLHTWSVSEVSSFWDAVWRFTGLLRSVEPSAVLEYPTMPGARWFPGARMNFAENLLRHRDSDRTAIYAVREGQPATQISWQELAARVATLRTWMKHRGIGPGDRVAAFVSNVPEAIIGMLAAASLGATWSSCSPDFGFSGVMDRFGQIAPRLLIAIDGYTYNGKRFDTRDRIAAVAREITSIESVLVVRQLDPQADLSGIRGAKAWDEVLEGPAEPLEFAQLPFDHPLYILYSSGTTGVPKCIVHGAGGTLIQHAKEMVLHTNVTNEDVVFYFTTCGWMMWNWLVSALLTGAGIVLFDGSPASPDIGVLWRMAEQLGVTVFGTSPKFLTLCEKSGVKPSSDYDLSRLRAVLSTGAPLSAESFAYVYREIGADIQLASISGGTDIVSCFMLGSPISPVYAGEIQKRGLGMDVQAWNDEGQAVVGTKGELVCATPFPSMPVGFYGDSDGARYRGAYFEHFPGVWRHGDYVEVTERGGVIVYGRSDATLNPGGVRIGTAEIYRQVEALDEVVDALVVGQDHKDDVRVLLFVVLREGLSLDDAGVQRIKRHIRANTTPRHVPAKVLQVPAIPRTISGKRVELAVRHILHDRAVTNRDALANPDALDAFVELREQLRD